MCAAFAATNPINFTTAIATERPLTGYEAALSAFQSGQYGVALADGKMAGLGGDVDAQVMVGHILMNGLAGPAQKDEAVDWYMKAAGSGNDDAMVALGELALGAHGGLSPSDAIKWLKRAADTGRTDAMLALAEIYLKGKGTSPDRTEAQNWLIKAKNYGDENAERKLGDFYFDTDPNEALKWYEKAAENNDTEAAYIAAIMYAENFNIKPDAKKAAKLLQQAARAGLPAAQADFGLMVYQGNGIERSIDEAAKWFKQSAENGDPEGQFLYAFTLAKGEGVKQSYEDAYYWLLRAEQTKPNDIAEYDQSRAELKKRLEDNVDPAVLSRARARIFKEKVSTTGLTIDKK